MPTYNKFNTTSTLDTGRKRNYTGATMFVIFVLAVAVTITSLTLMNPKTSPIKQSRPVSNAIVFGLPVASYSSMLKNSSLTELQYNATMRRWESHKAVTLAAQLGTPVLATFAGTVTGVSDNTMYGRQVTIEHRDGLKTVYSNLAKNTLVSVGQKVEKGHQIGIVGQTSTIEYIGTPHLRVEVYRNGKRIDPNDYIDFPIK